MKIALIPTEMVPREWKRVVTYIEKAWDRAPNRYDAIDIFTEIMRGNLRLWVAFDPETKEIKGTFTTRMIEYPLSRRMLVDCLAGDDLIEWADEAVATVKSYAMDQGCSGLEAIGRDGFDLFAKKTGWKKTAAFYEMQLSEGE